MGVLLHGIGSSPGLAMGKVHVWCPAAPAVVIGEGAGEHPVDTQAELDRYQVAIARVQADLAALQQATAGSADEETAAILGAQAMMVADPELCAEVEARLRSGSPLPAAVYEAGEAMAVLFDSLEDLYLRQRAADVRDVTARLVAAVTGQDLAPPAPYEDTILVTGEIPPSAVARLDLSRVRAIVTEGGGPTSHAALLAKGLGIPAVMGCPAVMQRLADGELACVDGSSGAVLGCPADEEAAAFAHRLAEAERRQRELASLKELPAMTASGRQVLLAANVTGAREAKAALAAGADGIGLFRTEFLFLDRTNMPGEEEQYAEYKAVLQAMAPKAVVIRTLDIGGDKAVPALALPQEENPFLGWRGVRLWLEREDLAVPQIRALLRAARFGDLHIMVPMVSTVEEVRRTRDLIERVRQELGAAAGPYKLGIMIEVPAAALDAERLSTVVDFFSIGTNDLVQYTLAADRGNPRVAGLYDPLHPAVLKLIEMTVRAAHARGIWVGVCGDAAGNAQVLPHLVAMGIDELSVPPASVPVVKQIVRGLP